MNKNKVLEIAVARLLEVDGNKRKNRSFRNQRSIQNKKEYKLNSLSIKF